MSVAPEFVTVWPVAGKALAHQNIAHVLAIDMDACQHAPLAAFTELKRQGVTYAELAEMIGDKEANIRNKLSRGKFSAAFLLQALAVIGQTDLRFG